MRVTIRHIAAAVGVNTGTVSRALNNKPGVRPSLRRRILRVAEDLGYRPNGHARGLVTHRTECIGLLSRIEATAFLSNPFYAEVIAGIEAETRRSNFTLMVASVGSEAGQPDGALPKFVAEHRVDGILVVGAVEPDVVRRLRSCGYPLVVVDYHLAEDELDSVISDNRRGARAATEHLIELGHRQIAFVGGGPLDTGNFGERLQGYRAALEAYGIAYQEDLVQGGSLGGGFDSMARILDRAPDVTGVFACNDANALAAMAALRARQVAVPNDMSVIGYDDIAAACESWPPLTTMRVDRYAMGCMAARRLFEKISGGGDQPPCETVLAPELTVRASTASPRQACR
ncbi:MAG: LacI family DNA-binding transcriptional regulator [Kiritimatiellae bacterium]|nr:LacI family DNA-binding transcriptional regulator [Kiritimatiellia bacterium]